MGLAGFGWLSWLVDENTTVEISIDKMAVNDDRLPVGRGGGTREVKKLLTLPTNIWQALKLAGNKYSGLFCKKYLWRREKSFISLAPGRYHRCFCKLASVFGCSEKWTVLTLWCLYSIMILSNKMKYYSTHHNVTQYSTLVMLSVIYTWRCQCWTAHAECHFDKCPGDIFANAVFPRNLA